MKNYQISELQIVADEMAYNYILQRDMFTLISIVQSICDFNLSWLYHVSPLIVKEESLDFFKNNISKFNRKLTVKEFVLYEWIILSNNYIVWKDFENHIKNKL